MCVKAKMKPKKESMNITITYFGTVSPVQEHFIMGFSGLHPGE